MTKFFHVILTTRAATLTLQLLAILISLFITTAVFASDSDANGNDQPFKLTNQDHKLAGKIWDVKNKKYIDKQQLLDKALSSNYVLLGETHDNMQHHKDHGWMIEQISEKKPDTAVAFEMINEKQAQEINQKHPDNINEVIKILEKEKTGWEYDKYYRPVFSAVIKGNLKVYPADLEKSSMMAVIRKGEDSTPEELKPLLDKTPLSDEQRDALKKEIEATHCGMINADMTKAMMRGQRTRDAAIGNNLYKIRHADKQKDKTVILVAGSGHVRKDRGAPMYLRAEDSKASILTIAWLEVDKDTTDPKDYVKPWGGDTLPFDYVAFTASADRPDPCEEMKKFMEHKKNHGKKADK